jgi:SPP1 family predicted phage head-tail adaptor
MDKAGDLSRRITIQSPSESQDEYGQPTQDWTDVCSTWASIRAATSKEVYAASSFVSQVSHIVTIRWRAGIAAKQRILYRDRTFEVQGVSDPDESRVCLNLLCIEINGDSA